MDCGHRMVRQLVHGEEERSVPFLGTRAVRAVQEQRKSRTISRLIRRRSMKYSDNPHYRNYIDAYAGGDLPRARAALDACLSDAKRSGSQAQRADLLQRIGGIEHELGNVAT